MFQVCDYLSYLTGTSLMRSGQLEALAEVLLANRGIETLIMEGCNIDPEVINMIHSIDIQTINGNSWGDRSA
jgi:hypothetical protein